MKIHVFQLNNEPLPLFEGYLHALRLAFPEQVLIWQNGQAQTSSVMPRLSDTTTKRSFSFVKRPHPDLELIAKAAEPGDLFINADARGLLSQKLPESLAQITHFLTSVPTEQEQKGLSRFFQKRSDRLVLISQTQKQLLHDLADTVAEAPVVYPPALVESIQKRTEQQQTFILGCVSPFEKNRGIETVIRALYIVREFLPQLRLVLVGEGSEKGQLQWLVSHLHMTKQVQFVSTGTDYQRFIPHFDALVLPDEQISIWNTDLIAAWAHGVPVIASQVGVQKELIKNSQNGLLFEAGNAHVLSQHVLNLYNHPEWREHYKREALDAVNKELSLTQVAERMHSIFADTNIPVVL